MKGVFKDQFFDNVDFVKEPIQTGDYQSCTFSHCVLNDSNLSHCKFIDCTFRNCDLSMANIEKACFQNVVFDDCKMLGLRFDQCDNFLLSFEFKACVLNYSSFYKLVVKSTLFDDCKMVDVDLVETDISHSIFKKCDLSGAQFDRTILDHADLSSSYNFHLDPDINSIVKCRFSSSNVHGLLAKYNIIIES